MAFNPGYALGVPPNGANVASLSYREGQIQNAIRFLQNSNVSRLSPQLRVRFLEEKGLTCAEIGEALRRTMPSAPETMLVLAAAAQGKTASTAVAGLPDVPGQLPGSAVENIQTAMQPLVQAATSNLDAENSAAMAAGVPITPAHNTRGGLPPGAVSSVYSPGMVQLGPSLFAFPQYLSSAAAAAAMLGSAAGATNAFPMVSGNRSSSWLSTLGTVAAIGLAVYGGYSLYTKWKDAQVMQQLHSSVLFNDSAKHKVPHDEIPTTEVQRTDTPSSSQVPQSTETATTSSSDVHRVGTPPVSATNRYTPTTYAPTSVTPVSGTSSVLRDLVVETKEDIFIRGFDEIKAKLRDATKDMQEQSRSIGALERVVESLTNLQSKSQQQYSQLLNALSEIQAQLSKNVATSKTNDASVDLVQVSPHHSSPSSQTIETAAESKTPQPLSPFMNPFDQPKPAATSLTSDITPAPAASSAPEQVSTALSAPKTPSTTEDQMTNHDQSAAATTAEVAEVPGTSYNWSELLDKEVTNFTTSGKEHVDTALQALTQSTAAPTNVIQMLMTANMYLTNLKNNPDKPIYRRLSMHNAHFKALRSQEGMADLFIAAGFTAGDAYYKFNDTPELSSDLRNALEQCSSEEAQVAQDKVTQAFQQAKFEILGVAIDRINTQILRLKEDSSK